MAAAPSATCSRSAAGDLAPAFGAGQAHALARTTSTCSRSPPRQMLLARSRCACWRCCIRRGRSTRRPISGGAGVQRRVRHRPGLAAVAVRAAEAVRRRGGAVRARHPDGGRARGWIELGERPTPAEFAGMALIVGALRWSACGRCARPGARRRVSGGRQGSCADRDHARLGVALGGREAVDQRAERGGRHRRTEQIALQRVAARGGKQRCSSVSTPSATTRRPRPRARPRWRPR